MAKFTVNVTAADIKKGVPVDSRRCPLALATNRALKKTGLKVYVGANYWFETGGGVEIPNKAAAFRQAFDNGEKVKPFSFSFWLDVEQIKAAKPVSFKLVLEQKAGL